jgi:hypothetical protein
MGHDDMKIGRVAGLAPTLTLLSAAVLLGVVGVKYAAARTDLAPPPSTFTQDGQDYRWNVAHGVTGSLAVSRQVDPQSIPELAHAVPQLTRTLGVSGKGGVRAYVPVLVLTCSGVHSGAVQARLYAPRSGAAQLRFTAGASVFRVYRGVQDLDSRVFVEGHGDLPDDFFPALAKASTVSVAYGDKLSTFPGPGRALVDHFKRYCVSLPRSPRGTNSPT